MTTEKTAEQVEGQTVSPESETEADPIEDLKQTVLGLTSEIRGLQSKGDKDAATTERRILDRVETLMEPLRKGQADRNLEADLAAVPDEVRPYVEPLYRKVAELEQSRAAPQSQQPAVEPWREQARQYVREMGIDPDSPNANYELLNPATATDQLAGWAAFNKQLTAVQAPPSPTQAQNGAAETETTTQSPRVDSGPTQSSGHTSGDEVTNQYLGPNNTWTASEYVAEHVRVAGTRPPGT